MCAKGDILKEMLRLAPAGTHYAFEPVPDFYQKLISSFPNVKVFDVALSDSVGEASFQHVTNSPGYSGLKRRRYDRPHETVEEIRVKTDLLDNIIPEDWPISLIKIDVEDAELQVLRGAANTIRKSRSVIIFEHGLGAADCYGTTPEQVYGLLTVQCDLQISLMEDWLKGDGPLSLEGFTAQIYQGLNFYFMPHPRGATGCTRPPDSMALKNVPRAQAECHSRAAGDAGVNEVAKLLDGAPASLEWVY